MAFEVMVSISPRYFLARCQECGDISFFDDTCYKTYELAEEAVREWSRNHTHG